MEEYTQKARFWRAAPFLLVMLLMLVTGGIALASAPPDFSTNVGAGQSGQPNTSSGKNSSIGATIAKPAAPNAILYDQYDNASGGDVSSQDFEASFAQYDDQAADDFSVPSGDVWVVNEVDAGGDVSAVAPTLFNIYFYLSSGTLPATPVYTATGLAATQPTTGNYVIPLTAPAVLAGNTSYWVSVQARLDDTGGGQWYWQNRSITAGNPAAWRNAGGGFSANCPDWGVKTTCLATQVGADELFRLVGTIGVPTATPSATPTDTDTPTITDTPSYTDTPTVTDTPSMTDTPGPSATPCGITFSDVPPGSTFYDNVTCLVCRGIISGYPDGTYRPNNNVTRGQLAKIVSNAAGFDDLQTVQMFEDVPLGSTFFDFVGRLATRSIIGGYPCGGPGEPCVAPGNLPYFRPNAGATRGQISKIDSNAVNYTDDPTGQQFEDVLPGSTYYTVTYRLVSRSIMGGYPCGGAGEPCGSGNLPYFRPNNNATRGQTAKIVGNTFFPSCVAP